MLTGWAAPWHIWLLSVLTVLVHLMHASATAPAGDGISKTCKDQVAPKDTVCRVYQEGPCISSSKCDGVSRNCPGKKKAPDGTPCNPDEDDDDDDDDFEEEEDEEDEWSRSKSGSCHRCYKGVCEQLRPRGGLRQKQQHSDGNEHDRQYANAQYSVYEEEGEDYPSTHHGQAELAGGLGCHWALPTGIEFPREWDAALLLSKRFVH